MTCPMRLASWAFASSSSGSAKPRSANTFPELGVTAIRGCFAMIRSPPGLSPTASRSTRVPTWVSRSRERTSSETRGARRPLPRTEPCRPNDRRCRRNRRQSRVRRHRQSPSAAWRTVPSGRSAHPTRLVQPAASHRQGTRKGPPCWPLYPAHRLRNDVGRRRLAHRTSRLVYASSGMT